MSSDGVAPALAVTMLIVAVPAATVLSLRVQGLDASAPERAQVALLNRLAGGHAGAVDLARLRFVPQAELLTGMRVSGASGSREAQLSVGPLPAGAYRVRAEPAGPPGALLVGRSPLPVATVGDGPVEVAFPVAVGTLEVRGAEGRRVTLEPLTVRRAQLRQPALRAAPYGPATAYFVDNGVYDEADGFWVRGARQTNVGLQGAPGVAGVALEIRNGPVSNHLIVAGAAVPVAVSLAPGQVIAVPVAFDARGGARLQIESRAGFVPAEVDPANRDRRFLGVYVRIR